MHYIDRACVERSRVDIVFSDTRMFIVQELVYVKNDAFATTADVSRLPQCSKIICLST